MEDVSACGMALDLESGTRDRRRKRRVRYRWILGQDHEGACVRRPRKTCGGEPTRWPIRTGGKASFAASSSRPAGPKKVGSGSRAPRLPAGRPVGAGGPGLDALLSSQGLSEPRAHGRWRGRGRMAATFLGAHGAQGAQTRSTRPAPWTPRRERVQPVGGRAARRRRWGQSPRITALQAAAGMSGTASASRRPSGAPGLADRGRSGRRAARLAGRPQGAARQEAARLALLQLDGCCMAAGPPTAIMPPLSPSGGARPGARRRSHRIQSSSPPVRSARCPTRTENDDYNEDGPA